MFQWSQYTLQLKKAFWFAVMLGTSVLTLINSNVSPALILSSSFTIASCLLAHKLTQTHPGSRPISHTEQRDLELIRKLEKKTKVSINEIYVCTDDTNQYSPNAFAVGGFTSNAIHIFESLIQSSSITLNEKKAIYAHEMGHLKHWDFFSDRILRFLLYSIFSANTISICSTGLLSFYMPVSLAMMLIANISCNAIHQIEELLADRYSAQYSNPKDLLSVINKVASSPEPSLMERSCVEVGLWHNIKSLFYSFNLNSYMNTHPSNEVRKSYLECYEKEMQSLLKEQFKQNIATAHSKLNK